MITYFVPHSMYPPGYHVNPKLPLLLLGIASEKNYISLHHMGLYGSPTLLDWFKKEYAKKCATKLDMGKSCVRLKKTDQIPYELIGELASKITPQKWIEAYESILNKK